MTAHELSQVVNRIALAYPAITGQQDRFAEIGRKLDSFSFDVAMQAVDDYVDQAGDAYLELPRLLAIAYRMARQKSEREQAIKRAIEHQSSVRDYRAEREREARIEALIADMTDEDVMREWAPLLDELIGLPREWAAMWPASKIRGNVRFKRRVGNLLPV